MKVCMRSSEASANRNAHKSSRNEITNDNLHDGLTNTPITMGTNDEPGYTSLQRESAEYTEVLDSPTIPPSPQHSVQLGGDLGYMHPQIESSQNNLDSIIGNVAELGNSLTHDSILPVWRDPRVCRLWWWLRWRLRHLDTCIHWVSLMSRMSLSHPVWTLSEIY